MEESNVYWWLNQFGIVLEFIGAALIVCVAFRTRATIKDQPDSWNGKLPEKLRDIIAKQAITGLWGFGLLATGLAFQFAGGFG